MGATMWGLQDARYLRTDGNNVMAGPLILSAGNPSADNEAVNKAYVDTLAGTLPTNADIAAAIAIVTGPGGTIDARIAAALLAYLQLAGGVLTGPLTLSGAPVNALHAATKAYADLMLPLAGGIMGGALTLSGAPVNALHAATKTYADLMLPLLGGTMGGVLVLAGAPVNPLEAATKAYVDGSAGSLATYDAVVAAAGGDYTSIVTACATEAAGARIFVKSGTYSETANIVMQDGQMLIGENPDNTIIDFGAANRKITSAGGNANVMVRDLTIHGSTANFTVEILGDRARVENCRILGTGAAFDGVALTGDYCVLSRNVIEAFSRAGAYCARTGDYSAVYGNTFRASDGGVLVGQNSSISGANNFETLATDSVELDQSSSFVGNFLSSNGDIVISGANILISGNHLTGSGAIEWDAVHNYITITGNHFNGYDVSCTFDTSYNSTITGNTFNAGGGIFVNSDDFTISGNNFRGTAFISLGAQSERNTVVGNNLGRSTAAVKILDLGSANLAMNNLGNSSIGEKDFRYMKNTSGGLLLLGETTVLKAVAAGNEITTTAIQGDDMVFGIVGSANIPNNNIGAIQVEGKTTSLKVNGTINIGIGDLLGTLDAAKIAMKAAAGDMAFAIALEAYAGADSLGVIDALLIKPRKV